MSYNVDPVFTLLTILLLQAPPLPAGECFEFTRYLALMREFPLQDMDLYRAQDGSPAGKLLELDVTAQPPVMRLEGVEATDASKLCLRRSDLQKLIVYRATVLEHDYDGLACVSFDEGRKHSRLFQRIQHNQGTEIRLLPFGRSRTGWKLLSAQTGFSEEAFVFKCGVEIGDEGLRKLIRSDALRNGQQLVREDGPLSADERFRARGKADWGGVAFRLGTGFALPSPPGQ